MDEEYHESRSHGRGGRLCGRAGVFLGPDASLVFGGALTSVHALLSSSGPAGMGNYRISHDWSQPDERAARSRKGPGKYVPLPGSILDRNQRLPNLGCALIALHDWAMVVVSISC